MVRLSRFFPVFLGFSWFFWFSDSGDSSGSENRENEVLDSGCPLRRTLEFSKTLSPRVSLPLLLNSSKTLRWQYHPVAEKSARALGKRLWAQQRICHPGDFARSSRAVAGPARSHEQ